MADLVQAIEKLSEKSVWDYLLVIIPILSSFLAIAISIMATEKQNKIALFEKRHSCLSEMQRIISFSKGISEHEDPIIIVTLFDAFWGTTASAVHGDAQIVLAKCQLEKIKATVSQTEYLFGKKYSEASYELVAMLHGIVIDAAAGIIHRENIEKFCSLCKSFDLEYLPQIKKKLKLH